jgi:hypothetical protein
VPTIGGVIGGDDGGSARAPRLRLWWAFVGATIAGALVILGGFLLRMNSVHWAGRFPYSVYISAVASWTVALLFAATVVQILDGAQVQLGAPHLAWFRRPWTAPVAMAVGLAVGWLLWK